MLNDSWVGEVKINTQYKELETNIQDEETKN